MTLTGLGARCPRLSRVCSVLFVLLALAAPAWAQTTLSGIVHDPSGRVAVDVPVIAEDEVTGRRWETRSTDIGHYEFKQLPPGRYRVIVELTPFKPHIVNVVVPTGRRATLDIALQLASEERVNVQSTTPQTPFDADAAGTTTFAREELEALPLPNGRTAQSLQALVPGVVFTDSVGTLAQFTAVGQRRFANRMTIDGVSADLAVDTTGTGIGQAGSGSLPAVSTLGGTQTLVPLDAIEEIQVRTTNATPEYQRSPGAQTAIVTRAGGNHLTGAAFMDLRPHQLTASDWFANAGQGPRREAQLGNGGASAGGPLIRNRLFYFASWERQQIDRPVTPGSTTPVSVPSLATRQSAPASLRPLLEAFPLPNGAEGDDGMATVTGQFPVTSKLSTLSLRADARLSDVHRAFARVNVGRSNGDALAPADHLPAFSYTRTEKTSTTTATMGITSVLSASWSHDLRVNVSRNRGAQETGLASYGDPQALPFDLFTPPGTSSSDALVLVSMPGYGGQLLSGPLPRNTQQQVQLAGTWSFVKGRHDWRFGVDYRRLTAASDPEPVLYDYRFNGLSQLLSGRARQLNVQTFLPARVRMQTWSAFAQDSIRVSPRISMSLGLRYGVNPAPASLTDTQPLLIRFETLPDWQTLADGSSLWNTSWTNFSPQLGASFLLSSAAGRETVLRTAWGLAFDDLSNPGAVAFGRGYPYATSRIVNQVALPAASSVLTAAAAAPFTPGDSSEYFAFPRSFKSPRTYNWQAGLERALGSAQRIGVAYVGAAGRDLVYWSAYYRGVTRPVVNAFSNDATSDYHALLTEYVRRLSHGFQARVVYTWSHAIDTDSGESQSPHLPPALSSLAQERASSDFDRRHVLQAVASYRLPSPRGAGLLQRLGSDWQVDFVGTFRSGAPVNVSTAVVSSAGVYVVRPDVKPGSPLWVGDAMSATGWAINADAFTNPAALSQGTFGRNVLRSSALRQIDLALSRTARFGGRWTAQVRVDAFNVFNIPNAGSPTSVLGAEPFGRPYQTYAEGLGVGTLALGGIVPVQQVGGPRSIQIGLRLGF